MHHDSLNRIPSELVKSRLLDEISGLKKLSSGASAGGARVHTLPTRPKDVEDDGDFHFVILGPNAVSEVGKASPEAKRYLDETTGPEKPRVFRNSLVLLVPSKDGLELAHTGIRNYLAWEEVRSHFKDRELDPIREQTLAAYIEASKKNIPDSISQAWCMVVTVSEKNEVHIFKITATGEPHFQTIKNDSRSRIQDTQISAEALLPEGPYNLWREGEFSRRVKDLVGAFAQFPHLPKMLQAKGILDTLISGMRDGIFVLKLTRPDRSEKTFWRQEIDDASMKEPSLEIILPDHAKLNECLPACWNHKVCPGFGKNTVCN